MFSDTELLEQVRQGDQFAFGELYVRHRSAALRLASWYSQGGDPEDLVHDAFERILSAIKRGLGPREAFRAYLFTAVRRLATDRRSRIHDVPVDEVAEPAEAVELEDPLDPAERRMVASAYESLSDRRQIVLWLTVVEGHSPGELVPSLGSSAGAVSALAYRAREKLRQAYLQAHLDVAPHAECEPHRSRLGAYVRDGLSWADRGATEIHLGECDHCSAAVIELRDLNRLLRRGR